MKSFTILVVALFAYFANSGASFADTLFHNGGRGECSGCHGKSITMANKSAFTNISSNIISNLKGGDPTSTCLICHEAPIGTREPKGHYVATNEADMPAGVPPTQLTPGGDFGWLQKYYGGSDGTNLGHSLVSSDLKKSAVNETLLPGINYPPSGLTCISCHDPLGNYRRTADGRITNSGLPIKASGSYDNSPDPDAKGTVGTYRLLAGKGYQPKYLAGGNFAFTADPPVAVSPENYNRAESATDTRVAYGSGMSEWCKNCHKIPHGDSEGHRAGNFARFRQDFVDNYNSNSALFNIKGVSSRAYYSSLVPFEMGTSDYIMLKKTANSDGSDLKGPTIGSNVMCLTCHRAHASAWDSITRGAMLTRLNLKGRSRLEIQRAFYNRPSGAAIINLRSLCTKCHRMD
jgi:hypothetical protein